MRLKAKGLKTALICMLLSVSTSAVLFGCKQKAAIESSPSVDASQKSAFTLDLAQLSLPKDPIVRSPEQISALLSATRYSALIIEEGAVIRPYEGPDDDYYTAVKTITAKVLETYRGAPLDYVDFEWALEDVDGIDLRPEPYIITLCKRGDIYYRQEVAADIDATVDSIAAARNLSKSLDTQQTDFSDCD